MNLRFIEVKNNRGIEVCTKDFILDEKTRLELKILIENDKEKDYYFIYTYDLNFDETKYELEKSIPYSLYIGKGNIKRLLEKKRPFQSLKTYKRIVGKLKVNKRVNTILRSHKGNINWSKEVDKKLLEVKRIKGEKTMFNKKDSELYKALKELKVNNTLPQNTLLKPQDEFMIKYPLLNILETLEVFNLTEFREEFIRPYSKKTRKKDIVELFLKELDKKDIENLSVEELNTLNTKIIDLGYIKIKATSKKRLKSDI